jgi:hypothetical protein
MVIFTGGGVEALKAYIKRHLTTFNAMPMKGAEEKRSRINENTF